MKRPGETGSGGWSRRDLLKSSGLALGGLALGARTVRAAPLVAQQCTGSCNWGASAANAYTWEVDPFTPGKPLGKDEMRVTFLGSGFPPPRRAQAEMSLFVEVGAGSSGTAPDQFIFDCGCGVTANYMAMGIDFGRMDKVFLNHLHGDHMSDVGHIYCFGPASNRKKPLYVWGPGPSGVQGPRPPPKPYQGIKGPSRLYDDGTRAYCRNLRELCRWHSESFSFEVTAYTDQKLPTRESWGLPCDLVQVGDDPPDDGYALYPIELDWTKIGGVAYDNPTTGVRITHFPVIHARRGSIGYKLEWNGLSLMYTSDTRPEWTCIDQASAGDRPLDVFIHEMNLPPEVLAMKNLRLPYPPSLDPTDWKPPPGYDWLTYDVWKAAVDDLAMVVQSSHTPQGAFGYLLQALDERRKLPRLTVATHFPLADDTVACALNSVKNHLSTINRLGKAAGSGGGWLTWSTDLMVITVTKDSLKQELGQVNDYSYAPLSHDVGAPGRVPKYWTWETDANGNLVYENGMPVPVGDPHYQIDERTLIRSGPDTYCDSGY